MSNTVHIAVDAMGGDQGPRLAGSASLQFLSSHPQVKLTLLGDYEQIKSVVGDEPQISIVDVPDVVTMADKPAFALRNKRHSSMARAIEMVAEGDAHACVSAGNTGALMAFGLRQLGTIEGVDRPAICKAVPAKGGRCFVLDLGANLDCSPENLTQFAILGSALAKVCGVAKPRVGVLNVGKESQKGTKIQQQCLALIEANPSLHCVGFTEGNDIYSGNVDVVVCDGFSGNVVLKASEGAANFLCDSLQAELSRGLANKLLASLMRPVLNRWAMSFDPASFNGAAFLGLNGVLVKSHGYTSQKGFVSALVVAKDQVLQGLVERIATSVS